MKQQILKYSKKYTWLFGFVVGVLFMLIGVLLKQENLVVLHKAIRICLECIGIG